MFILEVHYSFKEPQNGMCCLNFFKKMTKFESEDFIPKVTCSVLSVGALRVSSLLHDLFFTAWVVKVTKVIYFILGNTFMLFTQFDWLSGDRITENDTQTFGSLDIHLDFSLFCSHTRLIFHVKHCCLLGKQIYRILINRITDKMVGCGGTDAIREGQSQFV